MSILSPSLNPSHPGREALSAPPARERLGAVLCPLPSAFPLLLSRLCGIRVRLLLRIHLTYL
jgi:hypothetical protein